MEKVHLYVAALNKKTGHAVVKQVLIPISVDNIDVYLRDERCIEYIGWDYFYTKVKPIVLAFNEENRKQKILGRRN